MSAPGQRRQILLGLTLAGLMAGCSNDSQSESTWHTGIFADAPVAGLAYKTDSASGVTDAAGHYRYREGESISFSLGGVALGEGAPATDYLTPLDLVAGATAFRSVPEVRAAIERQDRAFFTLTNILVFLQTFDDDGDPAFIRIADGVADLLADARFDFAVDPAEFQQNPALRYLAWRASKEGLITTASPRKPGSALDNFYAVQGLSHEFRVPQVVTVDIGNNGMTESMTEIFLDTGGSASALTVQTQISGMLQDSALEQWTVNVNGDVIWHTSDKFYDDQPIWVWTTSYDALGMATVISVPTDTGAQSTTTIARDADGNETRQFDAESDGFIDKVTESHFDTGGRLTLETEDLNTDGTPDSTRTLSYDSDGVLVMERIESDDDADGNLDSIRETLYNSRGQPSTANIDYDGDGDIDQVESWTYDSEGRLLLQTSSNPKTGATITLMKLEYDAAGRLRYRESTSNFAYSWVYNDDGELIESSTECRRCFIPSVTTTRYSYDALSRRTTLDTETDLAGSFAERSLTILEYDDAGALTTWLRDDGADGRYELRISFVNQPGDWSSVLDTRIDQPPSFTLPTYYGD